MTRQPAGVPVGGQFAAHAHAEGGVGLGAQPTIAGAPAPVVRLEGLTHIGSLNPGNKGSWSLEGQGLSVSQHPDEWQEIARLGGIPVWALPMDDAPFLDYHELTDAQKNAIVDFGITAGYVKRTPAFTVTTWDDEYETNRTMIFATREEAEDETEYSETEDGDAPTIEETTTVTATTTFPDSTVKSGTLDVEDILATVWVSECATGFAGVWWQDDLDVELLSAPRGVIVPAKVEEWLAQVTPYVEA